MTQTKPALQTMVGDGWHPKLFHYFAMALLAFMLVTNVLNLKFIDVMGFSVAASQLIYVFSLIVADIMTEVYGYRRVRRVLYAAFGFLIFYAVAVQIAVFLPPAVNYGNHEAFTVLFAQAPRIALASVLSYLAAELINSLVMSRLKVRFNAQHFYGRALVSTGLAQMVGGLLFFVLAFGGVMPWSAIISATAFSWALVLLCETVILPITRQIAVRVKDYEGVEHFDEVPVVKPNA
jgi:queuosine precursor transporter